MALVSHSLADGSLQVCSPLRFKMSVTRLICFFAFDAANGNPCPALECRLASAQDNVNQGWCPKDLYRNQELHWPDRSTCIEPRGNSDGICMIKSWKLTCLRNFPYYWGLVFSCMYNAGQMDHRLAPRRWSPCGPSLIFDQISIIKFGLRAKWLINLMQTCMWV